MSGVDVWVCDSLSTDILDLMVLVLELYIKEMIPKDVKSCHGESIFYMLRWTT